MMWWYPAILVACFLFNLIEALFLPLFSIQRWRHSRVTLIWTTALFPVASDPSCSLPFIIFLLPVCKGRADVSLLLLIFKGQAACSVSARSLPPSKLVWWQWWSSRNSQYCCFSHLGCNGHLSVGHTLRALSWRWKSNTKSNFNSLFN